MTIALAVLLLLAVGFLGTERLRGKRALAAHLRGLRQTGDTFEVKDCLPPRAKADENGLPFLLALTNHTEAIKAVEAGMPPVRALAADGQAVASWQRGQWTKGEQESGDWESLGECLGASTDAVRLVEQALARPHLDFGFAYEQGFLDFGSQPTGHLMEAKRAVNLLLAGAAVDIHRGDLAEAQANLTLATTLVDRMKDERLIISQLVRIACAHLAINSTWELLTRGGATEAQLAAVQGSWARQDLASDMAASLQMERAMTIRTFDRLRSSSAALIAYLREQQAAAAMLSSAAAGSSALVTFGRERLYAPLWRLTWLAQDELHSLERWQRVMALHQRAVTNGIASVREDLVALDERSATPRWRLAAAGDEVQKPNWYDRWRYLMSSDSAVGTTLLRKTLQLQTEINLTRTAIALTRWQLAHGSYPQDLAALVPQFLPEVPNDLMDGQPLRYRPLAEGGYLLYSAGSDGRDDGGDASPGEAGKERLAKIWDGRDAVWPRLNPAGGVER